MDFSLTPSTPEDSLFLAELYFQVHTPEFAALSLPAQALAQLLEMQFRAQTTGYASQFPSAIDQIVWVGDQRGGRILVDRSPQATQLVDIALLERFRGHGIGTRLLQDLCAESASSNKPLHLTVRSGNPAERLYARCGLVRTGGDGINVTMEFNPAETKAQAADTQSELVDLGTSPLEPGLNSRYFRSLVGQKVIVDPGNGAPVELVLESLEPLHIPTGGAPVDLGDSFSLEFSGPLEAILPCMTLPMTAHGRPALEFFFSALGPRDGRMIYQSIFNRMALRKPASR